jgi:hypothetical protein
MKIILSDNFEEVTIDTSILWWIELDSPKSFDEILTGVLFNLKGRGFHIVTDLRNFDGWEYIAHNLPKGEEILA